MINTTILKSNMADLCFVMILSSSIFIFTSAFPEQRISLSPETTETPIGSDGSTYPEMTTSEIDVFVSELSKMKDFFNLEHKMIGGEQGLTAHSQDDSDHESMLSGILNQIKHGHVTQLSVADWLREIRIGINDGDISEDDYKDFVKNLSKYGVSSNIFHGCCLFG